MKEEYKLFVHKITPFIIFACDRYIEEQRVHLNYLSDYSILKDDAYKDSVKELDIFKNTFESVFGDQRDSCELILKHLELDLKSKEYIDPDTLLFNQIFNETDIILSDYRKRCEINKSFKHDIVCIHNFLESYFDDDINSPDPYNCTWRPTKLDNGMSASTMYREKLIFMDDTDLTLTSQYDFLKKELNDIKLQLFKKSMIRCLTISLDKCVLSIENIVEQFDSLWV